MTESATKAKPASIRGAMISGSIWMIAMRWAIRGIGLISTFILARLLMPEDFGIVDMGNIVVGLIDILFSFGVEMALLQNNTATRDHYDTAWTIRLLQSILVGVLIVAITPLAINYFNEPRLLYIMPALALGIAVTGFENIGVVAFRKELDFRKEFMFMVAKKLCSFSVTIGLAWYFRNYWALVCGIVGGQLLGTLFSYWLHPYRPRFSLKVVREIWSFSQWMLFINIVNYVNQRGSELVVGGHTSARSMGIYAVATEVSELPTTEIIFPISRALFPGFALIKDDPTRLRQASLNVMAFIATVTTGAGLGIALIADSLVPIMLGQNWYDAIVIIECLAIAGLIRASYGTVGNVLLALGKSKQLALLTAAEVIVQLGGAVIGVNMLGILGVAWAKIICAILFSGVYFVALTQTAGVTWREIKHQLFRPWISGGIMVAAVKTVELGLPDGIWIPLLVKTCVGAATFLSSLLALWHLQKRPEGFESFVINLLRQYSRRKAQDAA